MSGSAAYVLFYRRRHEAAADPPDQLQQLMEARALQVRGGGRQRFGVTLTGRGLVHWPTTGFLCMN